MGPVAVTGATVARGRSSRAAIAVTAIAVAAGVAAGGLVASFDRLLAEPQRYGASWDVVVGQYSQPGPLASGVAKLRANPAVAAAAGYYEQTDAAKVDGQGTVVLALRDYIGHRDPVMAARPRSERRQRGGARPVDGSPDPQGHRRRGQRDVEHRSGPQDHALRVVGILVVNDPITSQAGAGSGLFVTVPVFIKINGPNSVAQSVVIKLDPHHDRAAAIESVRRDFSGSIREAIPPVDARNLGHLRAVPWLIAALIAILALATLIHALVTMLARNRTTLAVLAALGFTRGAAARRRRVRQRRARHARGRDRDTARLGHRRARLDGRRRRDRPAVCLLARLVDHLVRGRPARSA